MLHQRNFILATNLDASYKETINEDTIRICDEVLPGMLNKTAWFKVRKNFLFYKKDFYKKCCYFSFVILRIEIERLLLNGLLGLKH